MADEQRIGSSEQRIGSPDPGASRSTRSATAATFQVDDSSLRGLHATFDVLVKDVGRLNAALISLERGEKSLDGVVAKLGHLGVGGGGAGGGGSRATGGVTPSTTTRVGSGRAPNGGGAPASGGGGGGQGGGRQEDPDAWGQGSGSSIVRAVGRGLRGGRNFLSDTTAGSAVLATGTVTAAAGRFYNRQMGDISDLDLTYAQGAMTAGRGFGMGGYASTRAFLTGTATTRGIGGYQSVADLTGGVSTLQGALGAGVGNARTNQALTAAGQLAALNPTAGLQGSAAGVAALYNPVTAQRLRSLGATPMGSRGVNQTPQAIYQSIQRLVFRGQKVTAQMIGEGMQPGAPLYQTLVGLGLDGNAMEQFRLYALAQANLDGDATRTNKALADAAAGRRTPDTRRAGLDSTIRSRQNEAGGANVRRTGEATEEGRDSLMTGFTVLARATDDLTGAFRTLNHGIAGFGAGALGTALGASPFLGGPLSGALNRVGGVGGAGFFASTIGGFFRGGRGRATRGGRIAGGLTGAAQGAIDMSGVRGTPVFVTNWPGGGGFGGGGGGGGGLGGQLEGAAQDALEDKAGGLLKRGAGKLAARGGRLGRLGRLLGGGAEVEGAAGAAGIGEAFAGGIGAAGAAAVAAAPFVAAAGVGVGLGLGARYGIHQGWLGAPSDSAIAAKNRYASDDSLTKMVHGLRAGGWMDVPGFASEWRSRVEPIVRRVHDTDSQLRAMHAINELKSKYRAEHERTMAGKGRTASGKVFHPVEEGNSNLGTLSYGTGAPGGAASPAGGGGNVAASTKPAPATSAVSSIISTAEKQVGKPYKWGGSNPRTSFDCSGLMQWSFGQNGIQLPRTAAQQQGVGTDVPLDQLVPGDLVFYGDPAHHVAMYLGNGMMVEAPHTGANIRNTKLRTPTNARRVAGGGAAVAGFSGGASSGQAGVSKGGDSGTGPFTVASTSMGSSLFGDELSALANVLAPPSLSPGGAAGARGSGSTPAKASSRKASGSNTGSAGVPGGPPPGGTIGSWVKSALGALHLDFDKYGPGIATIIQHESGGNPRAVNNWDSNAKRGTPSKGLMQVIDPTFKRWALPGHGDIWNPVDNVIAGTRYAIGRYGSIDNVPGIRSLQGGGKYKGYASGSFQTAEGMAYLHDDEMVVPATTARKVRSMLARQGQQVQAAGPTQAVDQGAVGRPQVTVHAPITLMGRATPQDARDFLSMLKNEMEKERAIDMVGSG